MKIKFGFIMKISELHDHASFLTRSFFLGPDSIEKGMIFETINMREAGTFLLIISHTLH